VVLPPNTVLRAFTRHFGCAPQEYRGLGVNLNLKVPIASGNENREHPLVRVENRPAIRIAYIRNFGIYRRDTGSIRESSLLIRDWAETRGLDCRLPLFGLCPDNRRITAELYCVYDIGIQVTDDIGEDDIVSILSIPAARYAITTVRSCNEQLISCWDWLCSTWRESHAAPYQQRWNYEVFHHCDDGNLVPERGVDLNLRLTE
jgi:DNA gyrase inhibitor GyrI